MPSVFDQPLPSVADCERALDFTGWAYEGGYDTALEIYREKYGDAPNFAVDSPDGGLLKGLMWLKRAVELLEAREVEQRRVGPVACGSPAVRRQDGWNAPASTPCKFCGVPVGDHASRRSG